MRFGFKNTVAKLKKFGKNAYEKLQVLGQKVNENKKLISMLSGLLVATTGVGVAGNYYNKEGQKIQEKIDRIKGERVADQLEMENEVFPKAPTYIRPKPKPSILPTDFWN
jgi:hypothetical protein